MADGSGTLTVLRSKTDQEGRGHVRYLGAATVAQISAYLDRAGTFRLAPPELSYSTYACLFAGRNGWVVSVLLW